MADDEVTDADRREFWAGLRARHPAFTRAVLADARITAQRRGERYEFRSRADAVAQMVRLAVVSDAYLAQVLYRAKAALQAKGVPVLPRIAHRLAMMTAQVSIGDPVVVQPGIYLPHGQVVIDGVVEVGSGTSIAPWSTIGLVAGAIFGPTIGANVSIGTGSKLVGPITVGAGARIGANAVVVHDVEPGATVVGVPARPVS
jgi:serine O-acetyltransferase